MVRMLHIVGSMSPSGIGNFIMNVYRNIDRSKVQFDFIVHETREVTFEDEIRELGGRIYTVTQKAVSARKNFCEIRKVVRDNGYRIVFRHTDTATVALDLLASWLGGAKIRIAHSHSTDTPNVRMHRLFQPLLNLVCTDRFACSPKAGKWLYGDKPYRVIINAIRLDDFAYDLSRRLDIRAKEAWGDRLVIGHVGNLLPVKNHLFMLDIMKELIAICRVRKLQKPLMVFVGDGVMRGPIEEKIGELGLEKDVQLLGVRTDTAELLQGLDVFLFPSKYEGLPIAMVEAQCAGLPCLVSDVITDDVNVTDGVVRFSLNENPATWAEEIVRLASIRRRRPDEKLFAEKGFDIREMVKQYEQMG